MNIPFKKAINQITGKTSEGKALPAFKKLLAKEIRETRKARFLAESPEREKEILQANLESFRELGVEPREVEKFKRFYRALPRRGPRNNSKK